MFDWNDLRYFLAVVERGSMLAAGRKLKVSQTTVARRIAALEADVGLPLLERQKSGYATTEAGSHLLEHAHHAAAGANAFFHAAKEHSRAVSGTVRITVEDIYSVTIFPPIIRDLRAAYPGVRIELDTTQEVRDLAAGEADVALRICSVPDHPNLVGRRLFPEYFALYCSKDYAASHDVPDSIRDLLDHPLIAGGGGGIERGYDRWLKRTGLDQAVVMRASSASGLLSAVKSGAGISALPCLVAEHEQDLLRCSPPTMGDPGNFWLLTHERLRSVPRVRATVDFLYHRLKKLEPAGPKNARGST